MSSPISASALFHGTPLRARGRIGSCIGLLLGLYLFAILAPSLVWLLASPFERALLNGGLCYQVRDLGSSSGFPSRAASKPEKTAAHEHAAFHEGCCCHTSPGLSTGANDLGLEPEPRARLSDRADLGLPGRIAPSSWSIRGPPAAA